MALHQKLAMFQAKTRFIATKIPIFSLYLARILQHSYIHKQIPRRLQATREIDIRPFALVRSKQLSIRSRILLFFGTEIATPSTASTSLGRFHIRLIWGAAPRLEGIFTGPNRLFNLFRPHTVVRKQAPLIPSHGKVVDEQRAGDRRFGAGVERPGKGSKQRIDIRVEGADFADDVADEIGLVWR